MVNKSIVIVGCGGHAVSCLNLLEEISDYEFEGFIGLDHEVGNRLYGYEVIGTEDDMEKLKHSVASVVIGVGQITNSHRRSYLFNLYLSQGFKVPTLISPHAHVSQDVNIGVGVQIFNSSIINKGVTIGNNSIINTGALLEHEVSIGENCHISTRAVINGNTKISGGSFVGSNAVLKQGIAIGANCFINMGLIVKKDIGADSICRSQKGLN